jgi:hypothetical protein
MGHSHAAYAREDVEDAKRGEPSFSLDRWATDRGLEFVGQALPGSFGSVSPAR